MVDRMNSNFAYRKTSAIVNTSAEPQPVWFSSEDISDADEPLLFPLFKESFIQWINEAAGLSSFEAGQFVLFNKQAEEVASAGLYNAGRKRDAALEKAVRTVLCSGRPSICETEDMSCCSVSPAKEKRWRCFLCFHIRIADRFPDGHHAASNVLLAFPQLLLP